MKPDQLARRLEELLNRNARENELQALLERHPAILTEHRGLSPPLVLSQLPLGADFVVDFAYFWSQSNGSFLTLVEIEPPDLPVFNDNDEFSARFHHALQQLSDWEEWCRRKPEFVDAFVDPLFDMGLTMGGFSFTEIQTRLIVGRRANVRSNARRRMRWEHRAKEFGGREVRTWDSLVDALKRPHIPIAWWGFVKMARYRGGVFVELPTEETASSP